MEAGTVGGIIGGAIGVIGGLIGTYASVTNTNGPLERAFMIKASVVAWLAIIVFLVLLLSLPKPYNFLMWIPYGIFLPLGIIKCNKTLAELRKREQSS